MFNVISVFTLNTLNYQNINHFLNVFKVLYNITALSGLTGAHAYTYVHTHTHSFDEQKLLLRCN